MYRSCPAARHFYRHCFTVCNICSIMPLACRYLRLWWKLWPSVWHHHLWYNVLNEDLFHYVNCGISHGVPNSPDDWKPAIVVSIQEVVGKFKLKEVSSYLPTKALAEPHMASEFLYVGSWRRSGTPCSSVLSVGCLLLSLVRILILWSLATSSQHQNGLYGWSEEFYCEAFQG